MLASGLAAVGISISKLMPHEDALLQWKCIAISLYYRFGDQLPDSWKEFNRDLFPEPMRTMEDLYAHYVKHQTMVGETPGQPDQEEGKEVGA